MLAEEDMKKNPVYLLILLFFSCSLISCSKSQVNTRKNEVIIYTYNSFSGEWGAGPIIGKLFEEKTGIKVTYADCGDSGQILSKAILEKENPYADVLIGIDDSLAQQVIESGIILEYQPAELKKNISEDLISELNHYDNNQPGKIFLVPYDYSNFAFIFDSLSELPVPVCLEDLTKSIYQKKIILMNPRTSTPGLGFQNWVKKVYGEKYDDYMKRLEPSILTMAPSWSVGYGMFTQGESPLVISYTTSAAYHIEYDEGDRFKALRFTDGHIRQIEGACIVKNAPNIEGAKKFMDFLISTEAQKEIPLTQWMYPANKNVLLPKSYEAAF